MGKEEKRTGRRVNFAVTEDYRVKIKEKRDKYLNLARELNKTMEHESDGDTNCNWYTWNDSQRLGKRTGRVGNWRTRNNSLNNSIDNIAQNTEKSPGKPKNFLPLILQ